MSPYLKTAAACAAGIMLVFAALMSVPSFTAADSFSIVQEQEMHLFSEAMDLTVSGDGRWTFVLTKNGMVSIYSASGELVQSIKAGKGYDTIEYSAAGNRLMLSGQDTKDVKILTLSMIYDLDIKGSPVKGAEGAPVTVAVFDDFQ